MPKLLVLLIFVCVLALSMGIKLGSPGGRAAPDTWRLAGEIQSVLRTEGYSVRPIARGIEPYVIAQKGKCRVFISPAGAIGYSQFRLSQLSAPVGTLEFRYAGAGSRDFPRPWPLVAQLVQRFGRQAGLDFTVTPVLAIARTPDCRDPLSRLDALQMHARFKQS